MNEKHTPRQVAKKMGVQPCTVRSWIAKGWLPAEKIAGRLWVSMADAEALRIRVGGRK
jgi:excisionase family DNA binding protein